jgi:hypothetical protein
MPNIKLYGYSQSAYKELKLRIDKVMRDLGLGDQAVTTWVPALVTSCDGKATPMPYIEVGDTEDERIGLIIIRLKVAGINQDYEHLLLADFTPARKTDKPETSGG